MIFGMGPVPALGIRGGGLSDRGSGEPGHPEGDLCGCLRCKTAERETGGERIWGWDRTICMRLYAV